MRILKIIAGSCLMALFMVGLTNQFASSRFPSCSLASKGIGVSAFGCSNAAPDAPCETLPAKSPELTKCVNDNYYRYKSFPFGFKQPLGDTSNQNDPHPKQKNATLVFTISLVLAAAIITPLTATRQPRARARIRPTLAR